MYYWAMPVVLVVIHIAISIILVRKYRATRERGLLWLGVLLVIWPLVISPLLSYAMGRAIDMLSSGDSLNFFPFTLVRDGQITLGMLVASFQYLLKILEGILALIAVVFLYRSTAMPGLASTARETEHRNPAISAPKSM